MAKIPVNVFTGFLGSGKTTIILNLVSQLPKDYKVVLLKNEFGNIEVDSQIAKESSIEVKEMINGCLCCVLVGKLGNALDEIVTNFSPDRIIIETSGSAYPAPIAWEIRKMGDKFDLDSVITVIDAINFEGYKDKSFTAKLQAEFTDLILINKHEQVPPNELDRVLDDVYDLNPETPKVKTDMGKVDSNLIFGIDTKLFTKFTQDVRNMNHHNEEVEIFEIITEKSFARAMFESVLENLNKSDFYRIKGMVKLEDGFYLVNYVFGKFELKKLNFYRGRTMVSFMGRDLKFYSEQIAKDLGLGPDDLKFVNLIHHDV